MLKARAIREGLGLSLTDVVRETAIGLINLSRFEREMQNLGIERLKELAALYSEKAGRRVTIDELVAEAEPAAPAEVA